MGELISEFSAKRRYFQVLDSWRGICACMVALMHFEAFSHIYGASLLKHAYLFVDFFFVLSGFVIAANYMNRVQTSKDLGEFMILRLGRLYPLHFVILLFYIAFEAMLLLPQFAAWSQDGAFAGRERSFGAVLANIFLVQPAFDMNGFNGPSWSIATEFAAYLLYAVLFWRLKSRAWILALLVIVAAPWALTAQPDVNPHEGVFAYLRCLYGFSFGVLVYTFYNRNLRHVNASHWWHVGEITIVVLVGLFVALPASSVHTVLSPILFSLLILIFAQERGVLSRVLIAKPFLLIGALSYSIYMIHLFLQGRLYNVLQLTEKILHVKLFIQMADHHLVGATLWQGDVAYIFMLGLVIAVSWLLYTFLEQPCRKWTRKNARHWFNS